MASREESNNDFGTRRKSTKIGKKLSRAGLLSGGSFRFSDRNSPPPEVPKSALSSQPSYSTFPRISLTSSTGSSSCLLTSHEDEGSDDSGATVASSSSRSSLTRLASRASDIQSYASRYLDSIRSKSRNKSISTSPTTSVLNVAAGSKSASSSRAVSPFNPIGSGGAGSSSRMTIIGHRLTPSFPPPPPTSAPVQEPSRPSSSSYSTVSRFPDNNRS